MLAKCCYSIKCGGRGRGSQHPLLPMPHFSTSLDSLRQGICCNRMYFSTSICVEGWVGVIMDRNENNIIGRSLKQCSP